jgi:hypothetical protein
VEHGSGSFFGSVKEKSSRSWGSRGLAPLGCLPHWGREGVTLAISKPIKKPGRDFCRAVKKKSNSGRRRHASPLSVTREKYFRHKWLNSFVEKECRNANG